VEKLYFENTETFTKIIVLGLRILIKQYSEINTASRRKKTEDDTAEKETGG
jgi:hypothetical protein